MGKIKEYFNGHKRILKKYEKIANEVIALEEQYASISDEALKDKTNQFKDRLENGETLDDILIEAFATVREAGHRVLGLKAYKVQIMGGVALHEGNIAEMKTGEGKTLTATMPVYLNALAGSGVHVVTVNDYLAERDSEEMGELYEWLGLSVGLNSQGMMPQDKKAAYACDITYSTNNELGFDYLRDNMAQNLEDRVQRKLKFAVVDETDSILVDEARTPLIISGQAAAAEGMYIRADYFAKGLEEEVDYAIDEESKTINLTEDGIDKAERTFRVENLYDVDNHELIHHIDKALQANYTMIVDKDYVVDDGKIKIVDPFTGRIMEGRQYSDGLHQAIEAKESVEIQKESKTMATITFQNYFRMYEKLSGMTGTAKTEEEEFTEIYNMNVIVIPTNKPIIRDDKEDLLFPTMEGKYKAVVKEIQQRHETNQPILVGTASVEASEHLADLLAEKGVPHEVLNAKNHHREAEIILNAGQPGAVTIATNMAGRGTDIKLGPGVRELGGLCVIGTERHESRRIDNQLRGRSGRQGDVGVSMFYLSLEDELMVRFGADRVKDTLKMLSAGEEEEQPLQSRIFTKQVLSAQERVEGNNYDSRKNVLKYDDVMREQREVIYRDRLEVLLADDVTSIMRGIQQHVLFQEVDNQAFGEDKKKWRLEELTENMNQQFGLKELTIDDIQGLTKEKIKEKLWSFASESYETKMAAFENTVQRNNFEKMLIIQTVDRAWTNHIDYMDSLKQGIGLRSYAQGDPLVEYQEEGYRAFGAMKWQMEQDIVRLSLNTTIVPNKKAA